MHTRKTAWLALLSARERFAAWEQGRALRDVARLFAAMALCTLIAARRARRLPLWIRRRRAARN